MLLELTPGSPVLFSQIGRLGCRFTPVDAYEAWLRADRMRIEIEVSSAAASCTSAYFGSGYLVFPRRPLTSLP